MHYKQKTPDIGTNIKKCREIRNYTQHYLADELNISTTAYRNIEGGKTAITLDYIYAIADILSVNINALLHYDEQAILNIYNKPGLQSAQASAHTDIKDILQLLKTTQEKIVEMAEQNNRLCSEVTTIAQHMSHLVLELTAAQKNK